VIAEKMEIKGPDRVAVAAELEVADIELAVVVDMMGGFGCRGC